MNDSSPLILIGIGTSGVRIARGVSRAFGANLRYLLVDTDAVSGQGDGDFTLLGGDRLSGHGAGGDVVIARLAAEDSIQLLDRKLEGVRLAVIVTALGGGTGGGATLETTKRLQALGIPSIVFASTPFAFEGDDRQRNARGIMSMIEDAANATFFLPLDKLVGEMDNMNEAMRYAIDTIANGVTLFWRLLEHPGYLKMDIDRLRALLAGAGRGRFATITVQGENRAAEAVDRLVRSELLAVATSPVRAAVCGIMAGDDLRLSEVGKIADGIRGAFGNGITFDLGTVNDEETFCGRLSVVVMLFETASGTGITDRQTGGVMSGRKSRKARNPLSVGPNGRGRFNNAEPTMWNGEDLDVPTFIRHNLNLEF